MLTNTDAALKYCTAVIKAFNSLKDKYNEAHPALKKSLPDY